MRNAKRGVITIAQGNKRYINMAINLAISLKINSPNFPIAIVTDSKDDSISDFFDFVIPIKEEHGVGLIQKLRIYEYSCFEETLFIDADCLAVKSIDFIFDSFVNQQVSCFGYKRTHDKIFGVDIVYLRNKFNVDYIIGHNGGIYYFKKTLIAKHVFDKACELVYDYDKIGIERLRGSINEEPMLAIAMSIYNMNPIDDSGMGMYTPVGQKGVFKMDALKGVCEFYKHGEKVMPAIMHFGGGYPEAFHYRREVAKLKLVYYYKLPKAFTSFLVNALYNPPYIVYVFLYRIIKKMIKGGKLKLTPIMPMFRFE